MSIYIKGFPMPNNCGACPLRLAWCRERIYMVTRPEHCPLVPVPEHGRLIDADALMERFSYSPGDTAEDRIWIRAARRIIIEAPNIIQAEPSVMYYPQVPGITPTLITADKEGE